MKNSDTSPYNSLYQVLFHEYPDAIILLNPDNNTITHVNEKAVALFGYTKEEFSSMSITDLYPHVHGQPLIPAEYNQRLLREERIFETECTAKNGDTLELEVLSKVTAIGDQEIDISIVKDVKERRIREKLLRQCQSLTESVVESPSNINIWSFDREYRYRFFNRAHEKGMKEVWGQDISLGDRILEKITDPEYRREVQNSYDTLLRGETLISTDTLTNSEGEVQHFENYGSPVRDIRGEVVGGTIFTVEITKRAKAENRIMESLKEKEVLLKEVHHRVKNNLQIISSLLNMQATTLESKKAREALLESQNRITSMALIHEQLYQYDSIAKIEIEDYLKAVTGFISESHRIKRKNLSVIYEIQNKSMDIDQAIPMGLIVNELLTNSMKYAREKGNHTKIWLRCYSDPKNGTMRIEVEDNGPGYPEGAKTKKAQSLGLKLVGALAEQLEGSFDRKNNPGAKATVVFPFIDPNS